MPQSLAELLQESVESVRHREAHALEDLLTAHGRRVVLFGCGTLGKRALGLLRGLGAQVLAFTDNNRAAWGTLVEDVPVLAPEQVTELFGKDAIFFVTIWNDHHWYSQTLAKLTVLGCTSVSTYAPIFWRFPDTFLTLYLLNEPPQRLYEDIANVLAVEKLWADAESLRIYRSNIVWRALGDASELPGPPVVSTYFPKDIFRLTAEDSLLDCGAFDGDTIRQVLSIYPHGMKAIYAVEADSVSFGTLKKYILGLPSELSEKIHPVQCAIGKEHCLLRFECSGSLTSKKSDDGVLVDCFAIDEIFEDKKLSMIKMDIEGAEHGALLGGRRTILRDKPLLAICVYHTQNDIWRIPLLVRDMLPGHRLFLRAYEGDGFQTVLYAVPEHRLLPDAERADLHFA